MKVILINKNLDERDFFVVDSKRGVPLYLEVASPDLLRIEYYQCLEFTFGGKPVYKQIQYKPSEYCRQP